MGYAIAIVGEIIYLGEVENYIVISIGNVKFSIPVSIYDELLSHEKDRIIGNR